MNNICKLLFLFFIINLDISCDSYKNNEIKPVKIIVLGSSTAAGVGPTNLSKAWVNQYRAYIRNQNKDNEVINLAVSGYTTYHIMPTYYIPALGCPTPDSLHNITKALSYNPDAIIVNMPTNDIAKGYSLTSIMANYRKILSEASKKNVPVWITTPQPRNFNENLRLILIQVKDSTTENFQGYSIDFWTGLANQNGTINSSFNCGDDVHLNDAGHDILNERVVKCNIISIIHNKSY